MARIDAEAASPRRKGPFYTSTFFQVVVAIIAGGLLGYFFKGQAWIADYMDPLGKAFVQLVKMIIAPVIFLTITIGVANMGDMGSLGRVAAKALGYFLFFSTLALLLGLAVGNIWQTGQGMDIMQHLNAKDVAKAAEYGQAAHDTTVVGFITHIIPDSFVGAFTGASSDPLQCKIDPAKPLLAVCKQPGLNILQVVFVAIMFGVGLALAGKSGRKAVDVLTSFSEGLFKMVAVLMRAAPLGALGAMAFMVSSLGVDSLLNLMQLIAAVYATSAAFIFIVLGLVCMIFGFSLFGLLRYLKEELFLVIGTSSSESALPALIRKMEVAGCSRSVVGLVVPTGYSFNLDGTNIYMTLAALFLAQGCGVNLTLEQQLLLLGVAMLSSKGAAGVTGGGFIALAATLDQFPIIPAVAMGFLFSIDRILSQCRSLTNFIGNAVATVVVSRWEGALDRDRLKSALRGKPMPLAANPVEQDTD